VQELVARLTQTPITVWNSTTNSTLDSSNVTFPLYQPIFVDATHDVVIATSAYLRLGCLDADDDCYECSVLTTLNFTSLAANGPLPTDHIPPNRVSEGKHIRTA
jgi:hypothetical protein